MTKAEADKLFHVCAFCRHCVTFGEEENGAFIAYRFECHRNPPIYGISGRGSWPEVDYNDSCGDGEWLPDGMARMNQEASRG